MTSTSSHRNSSNRGASQRPGAVRQKAAARKGSGAWIVIAALIVISVGAAVWASSDKLNFGFGKKDTAKVLTYKVKRDQLVVTVTEEGAIESSDNRNVDCKVAGGTSILSIVPDGSYVKEGDELVRLDSSQIEENINAQTIKVEGSRAGLIDSEKQLATAKISVREYEEGVFQQDLEKAEGEIQIALQNLKSAENTFQFTKTMARKGYATQLQRDADEFAVKRAELDLSVAQTAKKVLVEFTKAKMLEDLNSKVAIAEAKLTSDKASLKLDEDKLKRLQAQMDNCVIKAPQDGMVVYANDTGGMRMMQQGTEIKEGAQVREYQAIIRLPNLEKMQVKCSIHESKVERLQVGMRAQIKIQARIVNGTIISVAQQAEQGNWFMGNVKKYPTVIQIDPKDVKDLKPGMTAQVTILADTLSNVMSVPVQCVVEKDEEYYCWVNLPAGPKKVAVTVGASNDEFIEIKDGLKEGDEVLQNPRVSVPDAREQVKKKKKIDVKSQFGEAPKDAKTEGGGDYKGKRGDMAGGAPGAGGDGGKRWGGGGKGGDAKGGGGGGQMKFKMPTFDDFDKDKDGKLVIDELPAMMQQGFGQMDGDSDGSVTKAEFKKAMDEFKKKMDEWKKNNPDMGGGMGGPPG